MSQEKAASLTSNLFARKGRASPASLLISELEGDAPENRAEPPQDLHGAHDGEEMKLSALALNGHTTRAKPKKEEAELPLLAFVEAQAASDGSADKVEAKAKAPEAAEPETAGPETAGSAAGKDSSEAEGVNGEKPPAASLLDRGARALRQANGRRAAGEATPTAKEAKAGEAPAATESVPVEAEIVAEAPAASEAVGEEIAEPATVSGDANVTAIEDAPEEAAEEAAVAAASEKTADVEETPAEETLVEAGDVAAADAPVVVEAAAGAAPGEAARQEAEAVVPAPGETAPAESDVAETKVAEDEDTEEEAKAEDAKAEDAGAEDARIEDARTEDKDAKSEDGDEKAAAAAAKPTAPRIQLQVAGDTALSATVALRKAAALRLEPEKTKEALPAAAVVAAMPAPPVAEKGLPWRSAAVVAVGALLGLGAYVSLSGPAEEPPVEVAIEATAPTTAPTTGATPEAPETAAAPPQGGAPVETASTPASAPGTAEGPPQETAAPTTPAPAQVAALPEPSFDVIRIEPDGQSIIAGRAVPFSEWILLNNGEPIASIRADVNGEWVVLPDASLVPGANAFSLVPKTEQGRVSIPAPASPGPTSAAPGKTEAPESGTPSGAAAPVPKAEVQEPGAGAEAPALAGAALPVAGETDVALPKPKPKPTVPAPDFKVSAEGAYQVQVASVRQSVDAERERQRLASAYPQLLGKLELQVQEASVEGSGTFYRVRSGAMADLGEARELCRRLEASGQGCLVVRRETSAAQTPEAEPPSEVVEEGTVKSRPPSRQQAERPQ